MSNEWTLGFRCARVGRMVDAPMADEVTLLRAARTLKSLHSQLTTAVLEQHRAGIRPRWEIVRSSSALDAMERELREILLQYGGFQRRELQERVRRAFGHCQEIVDALESETPYSVPVAALA